MQIVLGPVLTRTCQPILWHDRRPACSSGNRHSEGTAQQLEHAARRSTRISSLTAGQDLASCVSETELMPASLQEELRI